MKATIWSHLSVIVSLLLLPGALSGCSASPAAAQAALEFTDVQKQTQQFIDYERTIQLTAAQKALRDEALSTIPAPCCSDNSAATCCCPCNMARSIWGLSNYLITERGADAAAIRQATNEWVEFIGPDGFSGEVCYTGGCGKSFANGGCGGMSPNQIIY